MATPTRSRQLEKYYYQAKIVVVGDMYVGKSASVHRLCTGKFYGNYMVTVGDLFNGVSFRFFCFCSCFASRSSHVSHSLVWTIMKSL